MFRNRSLRIVLFFLAILFSLNVYAGEHSPFYARCVAELHKIQKRTREVEHKDWVEIRRLMKSKDFRFIVLKLAGWLDRVPLRFADKVKIADTVFGYLTILGRIQKTSWTANMTRFDGETGDFAYLNGVVMFRGRAGDARRTNVMVIKRDGHILLGSNAALDNKGRPIFDMMREVDQEKLNDVREQ